MTLPPPGPTARSRLVELFEAALDSDLREREVLVAAAVAEDVSLGETLRALLASHERTATLDLFAGTAPVGTELPAPGTRVGSWIVGEELGRGGMGVVFRATHEATGETGALKVLRDGRLATAGAYARFLLEQHALRRLAHPSIARFLDAGLAADGTPYLVVACVEGLPFDAWCRQAGAGTTERLRLLQDIADAVAHAHRRGVLHRDLKPSNILVSYEGVVQLLDFGVARLVAGDRGDGPEDQIVTLTQPLGPALTPEYAPPEVLDGAPPAPTFDVYSFGIVAHEVLLGRRPLGRVPDAGGLRRIHAGAASVVLRALAPIPQRRFADGDALAAAWREATTGGPGGASPAARRAGRGAAIAAGLAALALILGGVAALRVRPAAPVAPDARADVAPALLTLVLDGRATADSALRVSGTPAAHRLRLLLRLERGAWFGLDPVRDSALARLVAEQAAPSDTSARRLAARALGIAGVAPVARTLLGAGPTDGTRAVLDAQDAPEALAPWAATADERTLLADALPYAARLGDRQAMAALATALAGGERSRVGRAIGASVLAALAVAAGDTRTAARWDSVAVESDRQALVPIALRVAMQARPVPRDSMLALAHAIELADVSADGLVADTAAPRVIRDYLRAALLLRAGEVARSASLAASPWGAPGSWSETLRGGTLALVAAARGDSAQARALLDTLAVPLRAPLHPDLGSLARERVLRAALEGDPARRRIRQAALDRLRPIDVVIGPGVNGAVPSSR
jgi:hypothetical protein